MIDMELILNISERQKKEILDSDKRLSVPRVSAAIEPALPQFARIITGIRCSGKSTLVNQDFLKDGKNAFYLNFDDPVFYGFSSVDFTILEEAIELFPFSFEEFCLLKKCKKNVKTFSDFIKYGGFPEYLIYNRDEISLAVRNFLPSWIQNVTLSITTL